MPGHAIACPSSPLSQTLITPSSPTEPLRTAVPQPPNHIPAPRFPNIDRVETNGLIRGYHITGGCRPNFDLHAPGFGADFKRRVRDDAYWRMGLGAFCEQLPQYENHVHLNKNQVDGWGIPTLHIRSEYGVNELRMAKDAEYQIAEMLEAAGCKDVAHSGWDYSAPGFAIHELGAARMGDSPKNSVLTRTAKPGTCRIFSWRTGRPGQRWPARSRRWISDFIKDTAKS